MAKKHSIGTIEKYERFLNYSIEGKYRMDEICNFLNISKRTLYRYIEKARNEKGINIINDKGILKCKDNSNKKSDLSQNEKILMSLMIETSKSYIDFFVENNPEYFKTKYDIPMMKVLDIQEYAKSKLNVSQKVWLEIIYRNIFLNSIYNAYLMKYNKPTGECNNYLIIPFKIVFRKRSWYIVAVSMKVNDFDNIKVSNNIDHYNLRIFRANRIVFFKEIMPRKDHYNIVAEKRKEWHNFRNAWEFQGGNDKKKVVIKALNDKIWTILSEVIWHPSQDNNEKEKTITFYVAYPEEMLPFLLQYCPDIMILEPSDLRENLLKILKETISLYEK